MSERTVQVALELMKLGVSDTRVGELLMYDLEIIEAQLTYLPYRKAKRPEAFIIEAIRHNYSPPKEFYYAHAQIKPEGTGHPVDQNAESPGGSGDAAAA